jgi:uncharacterized protein
MIKQIFVNLAVKDLEKTKAFWAALGFTFNPQFTDQNAAALVLGDNIFAMLLKEEFFKTFTKKSIADTATTIETINAISVDSREEVDAIFTKAIAAGGKEARPQDDYGWMYNRPFEDIDGHVWEIVTMDMSKMPPGGPAGTAPIQ